MRRAIWLAALQQAECWTPKGRAQLIMGMRLYAQISATVASAEAADTLQLADELERGDRPALAYRIRRWSAEQAAAALALCAWLEGPKTD